MPLLVMASRLLNADSQIRFSDQTSESILRRFDEAVPRKDLHKAVNALQSLGRT